MIFITLVICEYLKKQQSTGEAQAVTPDINRN